MSTLTMTLCSQCSSMAHFACIDHCRDVFCGKCSVKHRTAVRNRMSELNEELRLCRIDPVTTQDQIDANFRRASQQTLQRARDSVKNLINELQQREQSIENEIEKSLQRRQDERMKRTEYVSFISLKTFLFLLTIRNLIYKSFNTHVLCFSLFILVSWRSFLFR